MRLLNIGAGPKAIPIPPWYRDWHVTRLDVEAENEPDLLMDAMDLDTLEAGQFDAAYASHLLEHIYPARLGDFLAGVRHVLIDDGWLEVRVPDALRAARQAAEAGTLDALCYQSPAGPIRAWDMLYGYLPFQMRYGEPMAHHNGFSAQSLSETLRAYGFAIVYISAANWEVGALACLTDLPDEMKARMNFERATGDRPVHPDDGGADVAALRLVRPVAELSLRQVSRPTGGDSASAEAAPGGRGAFLPGAANLGGRL